MPNKKNYKKLSIIIPTYNEEKHIRQCLESLNKQSYPDFDIFIVDDGSTDTTIEIVSELMESCETQITLIKQEHKGPGTARNYGAQKARGEILIFVDADMTFDREFLKQLISPIASNDIFGTFSKEEYVANMDNPWARSWSIIRGFQEGRMHPKSYPDKQKVFRAILKSEFDRINGFDVTRGSDDDWSLSEKLGYLATAAPGARFYHYNPESLKEIFGQSVWMASRTYKLGIVGKIVSLIRGNVIVSIFKGSVLALRHNLPHVLIVQLCVDLAISWGILFPKKAKL